MLRVSYLSPKTEVRESKIHGRGLFATADITKDEIVAVKGGRIVDRETLREKITPLLGSVKEVIDLRVQVACVAEQNRLDRAAEELPEVRLLIDERKAAARDAVHEL